MKKLIALLVIVSVLFMIPITVSANQLEPLWLTESQFRNENADGSRVRTNHAMLNAINQFWLENEDRIQNRYQRVIDGRYTINESLSDSLRETLVKAWANESIATVMPFNQAWFEEILSGVEFYFWRGEASPTGQYRSSPVKSQISLRIDWQNVFVYHLVAHELGHALGLGEALADLFAEELLGSCLEEITSFTLGWDGSYDHSLDRYLLRTMENQGRGNEFWEAAFHSNSEYGRLWYRYMTNNIIFTDLELVSVLDHAIVNHHLRFLANNPLPTPILTVSRTDVLLNGENINAETQLINGRTMVPMRVIFEALGADVQWDPAFAGGRIIVHMPRSSPFWLVINHPIYDALFGGEWITLEQPAVIIDGVTFVPLRFVGEALGAEVDWVG